MLLNLQDENDYVRRDTFLALASYGEQVLDALLAKLRDRNEIVRQGAVRAIWCMKPKSEKAALSLEALARDDRETEQIRSLAQQAVAEIRNGLAATGSRD